jgi:hypothetical protein
MDGNLDTTRISTEQDHGVLSVEMGISTQQSFGWCENPFSHLNTDQQRHT